MNHSQRTYGPALSDIFSSDVLHSILSSPTDTLQALNEAVDVTKIKNATQSTKTKIQKFYNGDFVVRYNGTFAQIRSDLRKLFSMDREGATDYAVYDIPNGRMAFRLADHNANGNNFEKDDADSNISVYVAIKEYPVPESEIPFTEYKISEETFNNNREVAVRAIVDAVASALSGNGFSIPESIAERHDYPITESKTKKNMKKNVVKINENTLRQIVAESVKKVLKENMEDGPSFAEDNLVRKIVEYHLKDFNGKYSDSDVPVWQLLRDFGRAVGNNILALCKNGGINGIDNDPELGY